MVSIYFLFNLCQVKRKCRGNMKVDSKPSQRWSLARLRHITWRDVFGSNKNMSEREKGTEASDECFPILRPRTKTVSTTTEKYGWKLSISSQIAELKKPFRGTYV